MEKTVRVTISGLKDGMLAEVEGKVVEVRVSSHEIEKLVVNASLKDESGSVECIFTGNKAKDFLGVKEIPDDVDATNILELKRDEMVGRKMVVRGNARMNKDTGKVEFIIERIV